MPRPIADWRNPDATEYPKRCPRLSANWWAWEFLRRNPCYQDAWQSFREIVSTIRADIGCDKDMTEDPRFWHYEPERAKGEGEDAWMERTGGTMTVLDRWVAMDWGLDSAPALLNLFSVPFL